MWTRLILYSSAPDFLKRGGILFFRSNLVRCFIFMGLFSCKKKQTLHPHHHFQVILVKTSTKWTQTPERLRNCLISTTQPEMWQTAQPTETYSLDVVWHNLHPQVKVNSCTIVFIDIWRRQKVISNLLQIQLGTLLNSSQLDLPSVPSCSLWSSILSYINIFLFLLPKNWTSTK